MSTTKLSTEIYKEFGFSAVLTVASIPRSLRVCERKADKTFNMFKLILLMLTIMLTSGVLSAPMPEPEPGPVPPLLGSHSLIYPQSYVKVIPAIHPPTVPLAYHPGYKWIHPGSIYLY
ncbi:uncharacterized protein LOC118444294 [Vespa mandarinia]|uniref:uncharacterized protein LOC118444294 n=1 Tax=Vespa mandarinia TaxID=7446 RepID=UPI00161B2691|nr:uncharacterized protein LOC118444294 [Vespa mandarinia]